jgi:hypothetical protein
MFPDGEVSMLPCGCFRFWFLRGLAVVIALVVVTLPPLSLFSSGVPEPVVEVSGGFPPDVSVGWGVEVGGLARSYLQEALTPLAPPVKLTPPRGLRGWLAPEDVFWSDPAVIARNRENRPAVSGMAGLFSGEVVSLPAFRGPGSSQVVLGQIVVYDPVVNALKKFGEALKKLAHFLHLKAIFGTSKAEMGQNAAHHKENIIQATARHIHNASMKTQEMLTLAKNGALLFRTVTTGQGIYNLLMEHVHISEDAKKVIADIYDLGRSAMEFRSTLERSFELAYQVHLFIRDYRSWYRDADLDGLIDIINNFVYTSGAFDDHRRRQMIRAMIAKCPQCKKDFELYLAYSGQALKQQKLYEQIMAKIEEHKRALKKQNPILGQPPSQTAPNTPGDNTQPAPIPPADDPSRQNAAPQPEYANAADEAEKLKHEYENKATEKAYEIANQLNWLTDQAERLLAAAEEGEELEKMLREFFNEQDTVDMYLSLMYFDTNRQPARQPAGAN